MAIYIVVILAFAVFLLAAYRSFGGEPASDADVDSFIANVYDWVRADVGRLEFLKGDAPIGDADEDAARVVRKKLTGYQQQLNRLSDTPEEQSALHASIDAASWACRMVEGGSARNSGIRQAARDLLIYSEKALA